MADAAPARGYLTASVAPAMVTVPNWNNTNEQLQGRDGGGYRGVSTPSLVTNRRLVEPPMIGILPMDPDTIARVKALAKRAAKPENWYRPGDAAIPGESPEFREQVGTFAT